MRYKSDILRRVQENLWRLQGLAEEVDKKHKDKRKQYTNFVSSCLTDIATLIEHEEHMEKALAPYLEPLKDRIEEVGDNLYHHTRGDTYD